MRRFITVVITIFLLSALGLTTFSVSAFSPVKSYTYETSGDIKKTPSPYELNAVFGGGEVTLKEPEDMAVFEDKIYVLDSGNKRLAVVNSDFTFSNFISFTKDGEEYKVEELKGIFVNKSGIYVVDRSGGCVFKTDFEGNVLKEYKKPKADIIDENYLYLPLKVMVDSLDQVYILVENEYRGALLLSAEGKFLGFYGTGEVKVTAEVLLKNFWRKFKTEDQLNYTEKTLPVEYKNFTIDGEDFIYTVEANSSSSDKPLRKLNSRGSNILSVEQIGDSKLKGETGRALKSSFNSIAVDEKGFITVLDSTWMRLFQYNQEGELLYVFGGDGVQEGTFKNPVDVATMGNDVLVLDKKTGLLSCLVPTEYGSYVREGSYLFYSGKYEESFEPWQNVLRIDGNSQLAYVGIGKVYLMDREYTKAIECFRIADSKENYSIAFKRYRNIFLRENFNIISFSVIGIIAVIVGLRALFKKKNISLIKSENVAYAFYCVRHPIDGFSELRYNKKYCYPLCFVLLIVFGVVQILSFFETGFIFNPNTNSNFNIYITVGVPMLLIVAFIVVNWLMSSFFEGTGKLNQVFTVVTYALMPLILTQVLNIILSNFLTVEEGVFLNYLNVIGFVLFGFIVFFGLGGVHLANFKTNVCLLATTIIGIILLVFIVFLMFNLFAECAAFIETLIREITYRLSVGF